MEELIARDDKQIRDRIFAEIEKAARRIVHDDRQDDTNLPPFSVHEAVRRDIISIPEMTAYFEVALIQLIPRDG